MADLFGSSSLISNSNPSSGASLGVDTSFGSGLDTLDIAKTVREAQNTPSVFKNEMEDIYRTLRDPSSKGPGTVSYPLTNWYKAESYGFRFYPRSGNHITMLLPISPSNLTITTHFATNVIATMYGTVEEHSEQRYFDIVIDGNTGIVPTYCDLEDIHKGKINDRLSFSATETIPSGVLGGFLQKPIMAANQILNKAADVLAPQKNSTGVLPTKTGYVAFHNLYKFFLYYKKDVSGELGTKPRKTHPLVFFNFKDNNRYYCSIQRFTMKRTAETPILYHYTIQLRAYLIQDLTNDDSFVEDIFQNGVQTNLGLDGVTSSSLLSKIKGYSGAAKSVFGAASGGLKMFGV